MKLIQLLHGIIIKQLFQNLVRFINFRQTTTKKLELQKKQKINILKKDLVVEKNQIKYPLSG